MSRQIWVSLITLVAFATLASVSRYSLPKLESRVQILIFLMLTGLAEWLVKPLVGVQPTWGAAVITALSTTSAIVLVRWLREGLCPHVWPQCIDPIAAYVRLIGF
jgi:hypothetical protein